MAIAMVLDEPPYIVLLVRTALGHLLILVTLVAMETIVPSAVVMIHLRTEADPTLYMTASAEALFLVMTLLSESDQRFSLSMDKYSAFSYSWRNFILAFTSISEG